MSNLPTVLVVEDEKSLLTAITKKLELNSFRVISAKNVDDAMEQLSSNPIDIIWLDHYLMGDKNGLDLVARVKSHKEWQSIPIFVVSNTASDSKVRSYVKFGIQKYYVKSDHRLETIIADIQSSFKNT